MFKVSPTFQQRIIWNDWFKYVLSDDNCHFDSVTNSSLHIALYPSDRLRETEINLFVIFWTKSWIACFVDFRKLSYFVFMLIKVSFKTPALNLDSKSKFLVGFLTIFLRSYLFASPGVFYLCAMDSKVHFSILLSLILCPFSNSLVSTAAI